MTMSGLTNSSASAASPVGRNSRVKRSMVCLFDSTIMRLLVSGVVTITWVMAFCINLSAVDRQRRRQLAEGVDLLLHRGDLLLGRCDRVGAGDEPSRRRLLVRDGE